MRFFMSLRFKIYSENPFIMISKEVVTFFLFCGLMKPGDTNSPAAQSCQKIDSCSCRLGNGGVIDLHYAAHSDNGNPVFQYQLPHSFALFKYSPCNGLPCGSGAVSSSVCLESSFLQPAQNLGSVATVAFSVAGTNVSLIYTSNDTQPSVTSRVRLRCSSEESFVLDANTSSSYNFTLSSSCACPGVCQPHGTRGGMSAGTVLVLLFFSTLVLYFGIGCMYRKAVYGGSCVEIIPHREFWFSLPPLIKDGYMFFISPCLGNRAEYGTYDKL